MAATTDTGGRIRRLAERPISVLIASLLLPGRPRHFESARLPLLIAATAACLVGACAVFAQTLYLSVKYFHPLFYWDQWDVVRAYHRWIDGGDGLSLLFAQHNEHRIAFPRLIFLADFALGRGLNIINLTCVSSCSFCTWPCSRSLPGAAMRPSSPRCRPRSSRSCCSPLPRRITSPGVSRSSSSAFTLRRPWRFGCWRWRSKGRSRSVVPRPCPRRRRDGDRGDLHDVEWSPGRPDHGAPCCGPTGSTRADRWLRGARGRPARRLFPRLSTGCGALAAGLRSATSVRLHRLCCSSTLAASPGRSDPSPRA